MSLCFNFWGVYAQKWNCWIIWSFNDEFFKELPHCFSERLYFLHSRQACTRVLISPQPHPILFFVHFFLSYFDSIHLNGRGILLWFWFAFPWWLVILSIFSCAYWPFVYLPWRNVYCIQVLCPFFNLFVHFFCCVLGVFYISW